MKRFLSGLFRLAVTLGVVAVAVIVGYGTWSNYMDTPWTRDGHVRADVVGVTPDVSGLVSKVNVVDNQTVHAGDVLVSVDKARFELASRMAQASTEEAQAALKQAQRDLSRLQSLSRNVASEQSVEQAQLSVDKAKAAYREATTNEDLAALNLERSQIRSPADGIVTNLQLNPGDYVNAGKPVLALIDTDTLRVEGYFEENQLPQIAVGDPVSVTLMGHPEALTGHVESIAGGIEDRERTDGSNLLANVTPTFAWVRLAQRVPIRIALDNLPDDVKLVAGLTATVAVRPGEAQTPVDHLRAFFAQLGWPKIAQAAER